MFVILSVRQRLRMNVVLPAKDQTELGTLFHTLYLNALVLPIPFYVHALASDFSLFAKAGFASCLFKALSLLNGCFHRL
jgi:hypothetical protein